MRRCMSCRWRMALGGDHDAAHWFAHPPHSPPAIRYSISCIVNISEIVLVVVVVLSRDTHTSISSVVFVRDKLAFMRYPYNFFIICTRLKICRYATAADSRSKRRLCSLQASYDSQSTRVFFGRAIGLSVSQDYGHMVPRCLQS